MVRVHPELLEKQKLPAGARRQGHLGAALRGHPHLRALPQRNGIVVRKFFLHVSRKEQKRRFLERIENPEKNWKFSAADAAERGHWKEYMEAYEEMIRANGHGGRALVRRAGGQQVVHADRGGRRRRRRAGHPST